MKKSSRWVIVIACAGALALGCDGVTMAVPDGGGGGNPDGGGGGGDPDGGGGGGNPDGGGGGGNPDGGGGGGPDGGGGGDACATNAAAYCALLESCHPTGLLAAFETQAICRRVVADGCRSPVDVPMTNGLTDQVACEALQRSDCAGLFSSAYPPLPAACVPLPGQVMTVEGACFTDLQCGNNPTLGRRMYCRPSSGNFGTAECPRGQCITSVAEGGTCMPSSIASRTQFCDTYGGMECLRQFDMASGAAGTNQCRRISYGAAGASCFPGTEMQCSSGFECDPESRRCMAALTTGQTCIPARDLCDRRLGLSCRDEGSGDVCAGTVFVGVGAQCGEVMVDGRQVQRLCSAYARCDTSLATPVCVALRALDETCTISPDNCEAGLECDPSTNRCRVPDPSAPTCP